MACPIARQRLKQFRRIVWEHYRLHGRSMPWRETEDPYHVFLSEVMLQQTQVVRVAEKYAAFLQRFPCWDALAAARLADVVRQWQGLGYNRRARFLHQAAAEVVSRFDGCLPADQQLLATLPGIGVNTAGAICAFAFSMPVVFIETNIRRVFLHCFFPDHHGVTDSQLLPLVEQALDRDDPRRWYWALMDYGTTLKVTGPNPNRRSAHYSRQSRFEGSRRQLRGAVLRLLADGGRCEPAEIAAAVEHYPVDDVKSVLADLQREGFVVAEQGRYLLR
ncbi:MAG: A/G-specific adenine glycosylase [Spirochaetaceae bacterium]|nr:MAG: A/G-specific adenine glycosylase [Spirochaetaceae bacterium]